MNTRQNGGGITGGRGSKTEERRERKTKGRRECEGIWNGGRKMGKVGEGAEEEECEFLRSVRLSSSSPQSSYLVIPHG